MECIKKYLIILKIIILMIVIYDIIFGFLVYDNWFKLYLINEFFFENFY